MACLPSGWDEKPGTNCSITGWGTLKSMGPTPDAPWMYFYEKKTKVDGNGHKRTGGPENLEVELKIINALFGVVIGS